MSECAQVCDHAKWASALGLKRIIHKIEANAQQGTECAPPCPCMSDDCPHSCSACGEAPLRSLLQQLEGFFVFFTKWCLVAVVTLHLLDWFARPS